MFNLLVLFMGAVNIAMWTHNHSLLNLTAGIFAIVVFIVTELKK